MLFQYQLWHELFWREYQNPDPNYGEQGVPSQLKLQTIAGKAGDPSTICFS